MRQGEHKGKAGVGSDVIRSTKGENKDTTARMKRAEGTNEFQEVKTYQWLRTAQFPLNYTVSELLHLKHFTI